MSGLFHSDHAFCDCFPDLSLLDKFWEMLSSTEDGPCDSTSSELRGLCSCISILIQLSSVCVPFEYFASLITSNSRLDNFIFVRAMPPNSLLYCECFNPGAFVHLLPLFARLAWLTGQCSPGVIYFFVLSAKCPELLWHFMYYGMCILHFKK